MLALGIGVALVVGGESAHAAQVIGTFRDWVASRDGSVCFIFSVPRKSLPKGVNRDPTRFYIAHRPEKNIRNEVSVVIGYPFRPGSEAQATIDGVSFALDTDGANAFALNINDETGLVAAMKANTTMIVRGLSQRGTKTTDTYSLRGVTNALKAIDKACS